MNEKGRQVISGSIFAMATSGEGTSKGKKDDINKR